MKIFSIVSRTSKLFNDYPSCSKLLVLFAVSTGGMVAYSESRPPHLEDNKAIEHKKKKMVVLGTGWAGISFIKDLDPFMYDVKVVSPRNYFAFTPLLPSVTCGTVEARSIVEPIRRIIKKGKGKIEYCEAECTKIDAVNKKVQCRSTFENSPIPNRDFSLDYDYLVIAVGAQVNTFGTPGVMEHCHFLKEVEDAQKIRRTVIDCFEEAVLPDFSEEEKRKNLHFVIVGGGPTGVEFAAELHDHIVEDLVYLYPGVEDYVKITVVQSGDHILNTFDERISSFAESKFSRDGIEVLTGCRVVGVSNEAITMKAKATGEVCAIPYGMVVWSTGVGTRPFIQDFMEQIGQTDRRALATDEWLRVKGTENVFALGDCATVDQRKLFDDLTTIFEAADKDRSGTLSLDEFQDIIDDMLLRYPQLEHYLKSKHMKTLGDLLRDSEGNEMEVKIEDFKVALAHVDTQMKSLPATAQVAAQQGGYLARCFNLVEHLKDHPEGPRRFIGPGRHKFVPFRYKHLGSFAPLGGEQAAAELPGDWVSMGKSTQWLWYSVYASKQVSWRTRILVVSDWVRRFVFGRDSSRI